LYADVVSAVVVSAVNSTSKDIEQILQSIENVAMAYLSTEKDAMNENIRFVICLLSTYISKSIYLDMKHGGLVVSTLDYGS